MCVCVSSEKISGNLKYRAFFVLNVRGEDSARAKEEPAVASYIR